MSMGNVPAQNEVSGVITVNHGMGSRKPVVTVRFSNATIWSNSRLIGYAFVESIGTVNFTIRVVAANLGGGGTISGGTSTIEWWYW